MILNRCFWIQRLIGLTVEGERSKGGINQAADMVDETLAQLKVRLHAEFCAQLQQKVTDLLFREQQLREEADTQRYLRDLTAS